MGPVVYRFDQASQPTQSSSNIQGMNKNKLPDKSSARDIDAFLDKVGNTAMRKQTVSAGRLVFAMDATASREPTWDHACHLQAQMFESGASLGGLAIQLCYYRSLNEFHYSPWHHNARTLLTEMNAVRCLAGHTQIERVLQHALANLPLNAVVFIGDAMEEDASRLRRLAGELGLKGMPVFIFHEGHDAIARRTFEDIARLSHGACCPFDINSPEQLRHLLGAVAIFASGGYEALLDYTSNQDGAAHSSGQALLQQLSAPTTARQPDKP